MYDRYLTRLIAGDRRACREVVVALLDQGLDIKTLYLEFFQKSLYAVGDLWAANKVTVAVEHLATAITESLLPLVYPKLFAVARCGRRAVVSCSANEHHQIGGKMVADMMELNGWDAYFLGADTPVVDLLAFIEANQPDLVGLSLSLSRNLPYLTTAVRAIREWDSRLPIIVGGQAFGQDADQFLSAQTHVALLRSLPELEGYLRDFGHAA